MHYAFILLYLSSFQEVKKDMLANALNNTAFELTEFK